MFVTFTVNEILRMFMEVEDILSDIDYKEHLSVPCPQTDVTP